MTLQYAARCAEALTQWLAPFCHRIEVAGSIRRRRSACGDVDLVAIPRIEERRDLLGSLEERVNLAISAIATRCSAKRWIIQKAGPQYCVFLAEKVQVDIWFADDLNWGTLLMCRTGSKAHNIWLASRAKALGGHWNPHHGLTLFGYHAAKTEAEIYDLVKLPFIAPERRELAFLPQ